MTELQDWATEVLGHRFKSSSLLLEALTHTTFSNEHAQAQDNERMEFLGDAVVGMVIAAYLFGRYPSLSEGELTKLRAAVVCAPSLADRARQLHVGQRMRFGKGETTSGRHRDSILADAFEALVGALYLDAGWDVAKRFVLRELSPLVEKAVSGKMRVDYKTRLQEAIQRTHTEGPVYRLLGEEGPSHSKRFHAGVFHQNILLGSGWGGTKKEAEQEAAHEALHKMEGTQ